jgi:hypothetical protein
VNATPQIPHTLLLDLRSLEEGRASAQGVHARVVAGNSQAAIGIPAQYHAQLVHASPHNKKDSVIRRRQNNHPGAPNFALETLSIASLL